MVVGLIHSTKVVLPIIEPELKKLGVGHRFLHALDESLIEGLAKGLDYRDDFMAAGVESLALRLIRAGAERLVLTCSSLSPAVDTIAPKLDVPFVKVDKAMVAYGICNARTLGIFATNPSTEGPTKLIFDKECRVAEKEGIVPPVLDFLLERQAFAALASGDAEKHDTLAIRALENLAVRCDLILLAQLSASRVRPLLSPACRAKTLSSLDFLASTLFGQDAATP